MPHSIYCGATGAHGKNLAFLFREPGKPSLAPLYDTVPTMLWPSLRRQAAMAVAGVRDLERITQFDLEEEAVGWGLPRARAQAALTEMFEGLRSLLADGSLPEESPVAEAVAPRVERMLSRK